MTQVATIYWGLRTEQAESKKTLGHGSPQILTDSALSECGLRGRNAKRWLEEWRRSQSPAESVLIRADPCPSWVPLPMDHALL